MFSVKSSGSCCYETLYAFVDGAGWYWESQISSRGPSNNAWSAREAIPATIFMLHQPEPANSIGPLNFQGHISLSEEGHMNCHLFAATADRHVWCCSEKFSLEKIMANAETILRRRCLQSPRQIVKNAKLMQEDNVQKDRSLVWSFPPSYLNDFFLIGDGLYRYSPLWSLHARSQPP